MNKKFSRIFLRLNKLNDEFQYQILNNFTKNKVKDNLVIENLNFKNYLVNKLNSYIIINHTINQIFRHYVV